MCFDSYVIVYVFHALRFDAFSFLLMNYGQHCAVMSVVLPGYSHSHLELSITDFSLVLISKILNTMLPNMLYTYTYTHTHTGYDIMHVITHGDVLYVYVRWMPICLQWMFVVDRFPLYNELMFLWL